MYNLLPEEQKKALKREYHFRVAIIGLRFVLLATIIGVILLIPSFVLLFSKKSELQGQLAAIEKIKQDSQADTSPDNTKQLDEEVSALRNVNIAYHPEELVHEVFTHKTKNVTITKVTSTLVGSSTTVIVEGVAKTIDDLLLLKKTLVAIPPFKTGQFPVELLTKHNDITFALTLQ